jgi:hypothetical protein
MDKKYNILISAFIAFSFYILIILLFVLYLQSSKVKKFESISKSTILELDLIIEKKIQDKPTISKASIKKHKSKKIIKKSTAVSAKKKTNLKSLFARVSTKARVVKTKKVLNIRNNQVDSRFKSKYQKQKRNNNIKSSKLLDIKSKKQTKKISLATNKGNYDEYYSKISDIILTRWYKYPIFQQQDYLLIAEININNKGIFSYHIVFYSNNLIVDKAVKEFLENETNDIYPVAPDGKSKNIRINFKPEIKNKG